MKPVTTQLEHRCFEHVSFIFTSLSLASSRLRRSQRIQFRTLAIAWTDLIISEIYKAPTLGQHPHLTDEESDAQKSNISGQGPKLVAGKILKLSTFFSTPRKPLLSFFLSPSPFPEKGLV